MYNSIVGRGDQVFGCMQSLFEAAQLDASVPVYLLSDDSVMWLLQPVSDSPYTSQFSGWVPKRVQRNSAVFCIKIDTDSLFFKLLLKFFPEHC